jgi:serine/threonine protein kinase
MELLQRVFHPNICSLLAISCDGPRRCLVLEFCAGGALDMRIRELNCCQRVQTAIAIGRGLHYLHSLTPQMIHRDVKTANVLVSKAYISPDQDMTLIIKVSDFGTVRQ